MKPFRKFPGGIELKNWKVTAKKSPILDSQQIEEWSKELGIPVLPEMVFGGAYVEFEHLESGFNLCLNSFDCLKASSVNKTTDIKISAAEKDHWKKKSNFEPKLEDFDWTYTTDYKGTIEHKKGAFSYEKHYFTNQIFIQISIRITQLRNGYHTNLNLLLEKLGDIESSNSGIPYDKLKIQEEILFFEEIIFFEDELGDNGSSMRVMESGFFCLMRFFLRVDDVIFKCYDTRFYHDFETNFIVREWQHKEKPFKDLEGPLSQSGSLATDQNAISQFFDVKNLIIEKIIIK